tara:strand:- start:3984 stop:4922 length:939 start_codon:yes stop_codon:yes gene_type:complete
MKDTIPWVEKYRPTHFNNIIMCDTTKELLENIVKTNHFPNILFYGPPGTGKTTTIVNLINYFQRYHGIEDNTSIIHQNASDERGVDIIRNQLFNFVNSKGLYTNTIKFIILDEVDYMTKNAQQALKYLLHNYYNNVRLCLICNYISKIDESVRNDFISIRFNKVPTNYIYNFISNICHQEQLSLSKQTIYSIINLYESDIRSMINYLQANQDNLNNIKIIDNSVLFLLYDKIKTKPVKTIVKYFNKIANSYGYNKKNLIVYFFKYLISCDDFAIDANILNIMEFVTHHSNSKSYYVNFTFVKLKNHFEKCLL